MVILLVMLVVLRIPPSDAALIQGSDWQTYRGADFKIQYPANFRVIPSQTSSTGQGHESVFFAAPDFSVTFYVFWTRRNGLPSDIEVNPPDETVVSEDVQQNDGQVIRRVLVRSCDGSYLRSFEDTNDSARKTRRTFGMSYDSAASHDRYQDAYATFKASLVELSN